MKAIDYLNQVRMGTIEELRKAQEDCLKHYKINYSQSKAHLNSIDDLFDVFFSQITTLFKFILIRRKNDYVISVHSHFLRIFTCMSQKSIH